MVRSIDSDSVSESLPLPPLPRASKAVGSDMRHSFSKDAARDASLTVAVTKRSFSEKTQEYRERARTIAAAAATPRKFTLVTTKDNSEPVLKLHADKACGLIQKIVDHLFGKTRMEVSEAEYTGSANLAEIRAFAGALDSGSAKLAFQILKESNQPATLVKAMPKALLEQFKQPLFDMACKMPTGTIKEALLSRFPGLEESAAAPAAPEQGNGASPLRKKPPLPPLVPLTPRQKVLYGKTPPIPGAPLPPDLPPLPPRRALSAASAIITRMRAQATEGPLTLKSAALQGDKISATYKALIGLNLTNPVASEFKKVLGTFNPAVYTSEKLERMSLKEAYYALVKEAHTLESTIIQSLENLTDLGERWNAKSKQALLGVLADAHYEITEFLGKFQSWNRQAPIDLKPLILSMKNGDEIDAISKKMAAASGTPIESGLLQTIDRECFDLDTPAEELRDAWNYHESDLSSKFTRDTDAFTYQTMRKKLSEMEEIFAPRRDAKDLTVLEQITLKRYEARRQDILERPFSSYVNFTDSNRKLLKQLEKNDASTWLPAHARLLNAVGYTAEVEASVDRITRVLAKQIAHDLYSADKPVDAMQSNAVLLWNKLQTNPELYKQVEKKMHDSGNNLLEIFQARYFPAS